MADSSSFAEDDAPTQGHLQRFFNKLSLENFEPLSGEVLKSFLLQSPNFVRICSDLLSKAFRMGTGNNRQILAYALFIAVCSHSLGNEFLVRLLKIWLDQLGSGPSESEVKKEEHKNFVLNLYLLLAFLYSLRLIRINALLSTIRYYYTRSQNLEIFLEILLNVLQKVNLSKADIELFQRLSHEACEVSSPSSRLSFLQEEIKSLTLKGSKNSSNYLDIDGAKRAADRLIREMNFREIHPLSYSCEEILQGAPVTKISQSTAEGSSASIRTSPRKLVYKVLTSRGSFKEMASMILIMEQGRSLQKEVLRGILFFLLREEAYNPFYSALAACLIQSSRDFFLLFRVTFASFVRGKTQESSKKSLCLVLFWGHVIGKAGKPLKTWLPNFKMNDLLPSQKTTLQSVLDVAEQCSASTVQ